MTNHNFASPFVSYSLALLTTLLLPAGNAEAVGLGRLTVYSTQGRPLIAEVELTDTPASDQPLMECFRLGSEGNSASSAPVVANGRITLEQSGGRYRLHISSEQSVNDPVVQLSLRKGCGAEVTKNYLLSVPTAKTRPLVTGDRPLRLPRARSLDDQREEVAEAAATREFRLDRKTSARELARKRHPGRPTAQARYLRALQAANPDIDLGRRGQNRLPAGTWLSIPAKSPRMSTLPAVLRAKPTRNESASVTPVPSPTKNADRVIVSSGRPVDETSVARAPQPANDAAGSANRKTNDDEARLLAAVDAQSEQHRLLSEKIRLLDERIQELQKAAVPAAAPPSVAATGSAPAASPSPAAASTDSPTAAPNTASTATPAAAPASVPATVATAAPSSSGIATSLADKPLPKTRKNNSFWSEWGYELLFGALAVAIATLMLLRHRSRSISPAPVATQATTTELPDQAPPETISRWQLVGQSENLSVFDRAPTGAAGHSGDASEQRSSSANPPGEQEEMTAVLELAEIMVSFGRLAGAAQAIEEFIEKHPQIAVTPWLKLLEIYRQNGQREAFVALGVRLQKHFNVAPADWDSMEENVQTQFSTSDAQSIPIEQLLTRLPTLGQLPHIQKEIARTWATPACASYIDKLLRDNRNGERRGFLLGTVRELLLLSDVLETRLTGS